MAANGEGCDWKKCKHDHSAKAYYRGGCNRDKCNLCIQVASIDMEHLKEFHIATHHDFLECKLQNVEKEFAKLKLQAETKKAQPTQQPAQKPPPEIHLKIDPKNYVPNRCCYVRVDPHDRIGYKCTEPSSYMEDFCSAHKAGGKYRVYPPEDIKKVNNGSEKSI